MDIKYIGNNNPKLKSKKYEGVKLSYRKSADDLSNHKDFEAFIKGCEYQVRNDPRYNNYLHTLKENGFDKCTVYGKIKGNMASLEMHHGPLFTLFDICGIVTDWLLSKEEDVTTFKVADVVLKEHELHHIQVVMVCKTAHQLIHSGKQFIYYKQAWGDIMSFIKQYKKGVKEEHMYTMFEYLDQCEKKDALLENDMLKVVKKCKKLV